MESIYMECNCIENALKITIVLLMASVAHLDSRESILDTRTPTLDSNLSIKEQSSIKPNNFAFMSSTIQTWAKLPRPSGRSGIRPDG